MSANNYIEINRETFEVWDKDVETSTNNIFVGEANTLERAIELANKYMGENIVEYGITFKQEPDLNKANQEHQDIDNRSYLIGYQDGFDMKMKPIKEVKKAIIEEIIEELKKKSDQIIKRQIYEDRGNVK